MTTGTVLARLSQRLVRRETYEAIVAPAIADLQFEANGGPWPRMRAYAGAWRALVAAVGGEVLDDCRGTLRAARAGSVIGPALLTVGILTALGSAPILVGAVKSPRPWHHEAVVLLLLVPGMLTFALPAAALPLATRLARAGQPGARRAAFLLASFAMCVVILANQQLVEHTDRLRRELILASGWSLRDATVRDRPLWELRNAMRDRLDEIAARERVSKQRWPPELARRSARNEWHKRSAAVLAMLTYAVLGAAWWRLRSVWSLVGTAFALFIAQGVLRFVFQGVLYVQNVFGFWAAVWTPVVLLFLTSALIALRAKGRLKPAPTTVNGRDD